MSKTLQFTIQLMGSNPLIWRTFKVSDSYRLDRFHQVIQIVMGWHNAHLHEFRIKERQFGMLMGDGFDFPEVEDETTIFLKDLSLEQGVMISYLYDFGDSWEHLIKLEKITTEKLEVPVCLEGERAGPPEDCGGVWGYSDLLEILKKPSDPEYDSWMEWLPDGFDPTKFPKRSINSELKKFGKWHNKNPSAKSTPWHFVR